ncbi:sulfotransferase [Xinfangfangia pollutisoli]|uniref:sulfotransferase n=1 Tax=Xinfangfangia pollutisoli TaxID=2865960 RepID=UPI001CD66075|nr:sulfotransferase [Xinfangfangia pollutisoli]
MTKSRKSLRFITGMHRSGTTWIGEVAAHAMPGAVLHEPFNAASGLPGVDRWYLGPQDEETAVSLVGRLLDGKIGYRRRRPSDGLLKALGRGLLGSQYDRDLKAALGSDAPALILKDPFLIRLGAVLARRFDARGVCLVRHPAALVNSLRRMNWQLPLIDGQAWDRRHDDADLQFAFTLGQFWARLYAEVLDQVAAEPARLRLVRHEDLCADPHAEGEAILRHLTLPVTDQAMGFLTRSTTGDAGEMSGNQLHQMTRNARELAQSWKASLAPAQAEAVIEGAGPVLARIYPNG